MQLREFVDPSDVPGLASSRGACSRAGLQLRGSVLALLFGSICAWGCPFARSGQSDEHASVGPATTVDWVLDRDDGALIGLDARALVTARRPLPFPVQLAPDPAGGAWIGCAVDGHPAGRWRLERLDATQRGLELQHPVRILEMASGGDPLAACWVLCASGPARTLLVLRGGQLLGALALPNECGRLLVSSGQLWAADEGRLWCHPVPGGTAGAQATGWRARELPGSAPNLASGFAWYADGEGGVWVLLHGDLIARAQLWHTSLAGGWQRLQRGVELLALARGGGELWSIGSNLRPERLARGSLALDPLSAPVATIQESLAGSDLGQELRSLAGAKPDRLRLHRGVRGWTLVERGSLQHFDARGRRFAGQGGFARIAGSWIEALPP